MATTSKGRGRPNGRCAKSNGDWLTAKDVAKMIGVHVVTVNRWRLLNPYYGPPFYRHDRFYVRYLRSEVMAWNKARNVKVTR